MARGVIKSFLYYLYLCGGALAKFIHWYVIWCSSFEALFGIPLVPVWQLYAGNILFALLYSIATNNAQSFFVITFGQYACWCLAYLKMPMETTAAATLLVRSSESYRYYHFMILALHWARFVISYSLGNLSPETFHYLVFFLCLIFTYALLPLVKDVNNIIRCVAISYTAKYFVTGKLNFIVQPRSIEYDHQSYMFSPMMQGLLICLILSFPFDSEKIRRYLFSRSN